MPLKIGPWGPRKKASAADARSARLSNRPPAPRPSSPASNAAPSSPMRPARTSCAALYCGHENTIHEVETEIVEHSLDDALASGVGAAPIEETQTVKCASCAAEFTFDPATHAGSCPFCGHSIVESTGVNRQIKPAAMLPFLITEQEAKAEVKRWLQNLWFAPTKLKTYARDEGRLSWRLPAVLDLRQSDADALPRPTRRFLHGADAGPHPRQRPHGDPDPTGAKGTLAARPAARSAASSMTFWCWPAAHCRPG